MYVLYSLLYVYTLFLWSQALDPLMQYLSKGMQVFNSFLSKQVLDVYVHYHYQTCVLLTYNYVTIVVV